MNDVPLKAWQYPSSRLLTVASDTDRLRSSPWLSTLYGSRAPHPPDPWVQAMYYLALLSIWMWPQTVWPNSRRSSENIHVSEAVRSSPSSVLLHPGAAVVEEAQARVAVAVSYPADCDSGLLQHLVQGGLLNGCWWDSLLVCQGLQLPVRETGPVSPPPFKNQRLGKLAQLLTFNLTHRYILRPAKLR